MAVCEICDMDESWCVHGLARRRAIVERSAALEVSPRGMAHLPGCSHKDDPDYTRWGVLSEPGAWQALANGSTLATVDQAGRELIATSRCTTCIDHGPWS